MYNLKMTDKVGKNNGDWKITDWKITDWKMTDLIKFSATLSTLLRP